MSQEPLIEEFYLGEKNLEAYYTEYPCSAMAVQPHLGPSDRRAREVEAYGYCRKPPKSGRKACFAARSLAEVDLGSVAALRSVIDDLQPGWVEEVKDATLVFNEPEKIADWCELSLNVIIAILANLHGRGELPDLEL